jgi:predicted secreted protein
VRFISSSYQAPKQNRAGAPGQQLLTFEATKAGNGPVNLVYERPFAPDEPGKSLTFSVDAGDA